MEVNEGSLSGFQFSSNKIMYQQAKIEFEVHARETNLGSESFLEVNRTRLSNNCKILFDLFMKGARLHTGNSPVGDFRARVGDLWRENGVRLHNRTIKLGKSTLKE